MSKEEFEKGKKISLLAKLSKKFNKNYLKIFLYFLLALFVLGITFYVAMLFDTKFVVTQKLLTQPTEPKTINEIYDKNYLVFLLEPDKEELKDFSLEDYEKGVNQVTRMFLPTLRVENLFKTNATVLDFIGRDTYPTSIVRGNISQDGDLLFREEDKLFLWNQQTKQIEQLAFLEEQHTYLSDYVFSKEGDKIAYLVSPNWRKDVNSKLVIYDRKSRLEVELTLGEISGLFDVFDDISKQPPDALARGALIGVRGLSNISIIGFLDKELLLVTGETYFWGLDSPGEPYVFIINFQDKKVEQSFLGKLLDFYKSEEKELLLVSAEESCLGSGPVFRPCNATVKLIERKTEQEQVLFNELQRYQEDRERYYELIKAGRFSKDGRYIFLSLGSADVLLSNGRSEDIIVFCSKEEENLFFEEIYSKTLERYFTRHQLEAILSSSKILISGATSADERKARLFIFDLESEEARKIPEHGSLIGIY